MLAAIAALVLLAPPATHVSTAADRNERTRSAEDAPAVILWDNPRRAGEPGELATIWTPIIVDKVPHRADVESAVVLDAIEQAKLGDEVIAVIGGDDDQDQGGIAGSGPTIIMTLIQAPSSVVVPAQRSLERVVAYLESILADQVTIRIGVAFRSTGAPNILGIIH